MRVSFRGEDRRPKEREISHSADSVRSDRQSKSKKPKEEGLWRSSVRATLRTAAKDGARSSSEEQQRYREKAQLLLDHAVFQEIFEFGHELLDVFEIHVDAGEADVGDLIEFFEAMHDHFTDFGGSEFALSGFVDHTFDFVDDGFEFGRGDGALFAGFQKSLQNFLALEAFAPAVFLDNHVRDFIDAFVGGEAAGTFQAFTATADGVAGAALTRVNYLVIDVRAEGALHSKVSPLGTVEPL